MFRAAVKIVTKLMNKPRSLSFHVTIWLAIAVAIGMGAYAALEYLTTPGVTALGLLVHHGWHVLALGTSFYVVSWFAINRLVVRPLNEVYLHLYATGGGQRSLLDLRTNVAEIESIVEGINLMLLRWNKPQPDPSLSDLETEIRLVRQEVEQLASIAPRAKTAMLERLGVLAASVEEIESSALVPAEQR